MVIETYDIYLWYMTPHDKMIARMLYLSKEQNKLCKEEMASYKKEHTPAYKIDNRTIYDILE